MSSERQTTILGLVEEAKKRILFLVICVVGLSYLMSLTSSSVWVNLPAAALLIIFLRYLSLDFDVRRKEMYKSKSSSASTSLQKEPLEIKAVDRSHWRRKINSPVVEDAIEQFTRHLVSEWVTDLWYSRITPDKQAPDELVLIMNGVLGELSCRMRNINLIDFLTRDIVNIICNHLELFRARQKKNVRQQLDDINFDQWDMELKSSLVTDNKLHPALFSAEAEHKVLQHLMDGLISFTFKPEDLQCSFFRYTVRELLACAVIRPVLNLANPRFVNERIEALVISRLKATKGASLVQGASPSKENDSSRISCDHFSRFLDPSVTGVELVQLKNGHLRAADKSTVNNGMHQSKDPLLSVDTQTTRSWSSLSSDTQFGNTQGIRRYRSGGEWGDMLDMMSHRKTQALAPENFENMWTRGRNYRKREGQNRLVEQVPQRSSAGTFSATKNSKMDCKQSKKEDMTKVNYLESDVISLAGNCQPQPEKAFFNKETTISGHSPVMIHKNDDEDDLIHFQEVGSESSSSYSTSDVEASSVTGLDSPVTKVWDGRNNRNLSVSHVHHPLESSEGHTGRNTGKGHARFHRFSSAQSGRGRRSRRSGQKVHIWKEVERTSFLSGDGQDLLNSLKEHAKSEVSSDDSEAEIMGRVHSGASASSSVPLSHSSAVNSLQKSLLPNSFLKLRCEVLGANIVKGGSRPFAVYCISVTDVNSSWSIKRRFRHFEQLHRRLKEFLEYNLHLPPKHFLSTGLDVTVIQERCKLLDVYLKKLLQLPTISGSIEVWDFLSVDSQTYMFLNSFSVIETLSVDLDDKPSGSAGKGPSFTGPATDSLSSKRELLAESKEFILQKKHNSVPDKSEKKSKYVPHSAVEKSNTERRNQLANSGSDSDARAKKDFSPRDLRKDVRRREGDGEDTYELLLDASIDPALPTEWLPPNLSIPILDLVDVIFQLQDGGWIRRKAFWVAKQVLQLGMGDAFDDWLIDKIQHLRKGSVIASGIRRVEQILWPDGIFITRHPKRQRPTPPMNPSKSPTSTRQLTEVSSPRNDDIQKLCDEQQKQEAFRRAKFVYELMIDNAPAAVVGLVGRKEYEQCVKDLYFFLQSSVCLKQVAFDLLELLLLSAFPELDHVIKQVHEEKHKFGEFKPN